MRVLPVTILRGRRQWFCRPPRSRLLLADDHIETAELLRELLQPEFEVIGHVTDGCTLVGAAERLLPDLIASDISMPGMEESPQPPRFFTRTPRARIVFVTVNGDPVVVSRGLATGALGYVLKLAAGDDVIPAVHAALRGERPVSQSLDFEDSDHDTRTN